MSWDNFFLFSGKKHTDYKNGVGKLFVDIELKENLCDVFTNLHGQPPNSKL